MFEKFALALLAVVASAAPAFADTVTNVSITIPLAFKNLDPSIVSAQLECVLSAAPVQDLTYDSTLFSPGAPNSVRVNVPIANGSNTQPSATLQYALPTAQVATFSSYACTVLNFYSQANPYITPSTIVPAPGTTPTFLVVGPLKSNSRGR